MDEAFIEIADVTKITGLSRDHLKQLRHFGAGPKFYKPTPRRVLYRRSEVIAWMESKAQVSTAATK